MAKISCAGGFPATLSGKKGAGIWPYKRGHGGNGSRQKALFRWEGMGEGVLPEINVGIQTRFHQNHCFL